MPPLTGPRLSPDGGKRHVRWGGGGQETGKRATALGNVRLRRKRQGCAPEPTARQHRACPLPDR